MKIAWITPCSKTYYSINKYFPDIEKCNWHIHIFQDTENLKPIETTIFQPNIKDLEKLRRYYVVLHYFLDDCENCKKMKFKSTFGQRLFVSHNFNNPEFKDIIFKYLEVI
jgi:hypothetical protein